MTLLEALRSRVEIRPGPRVRTMGGWCRRDQILLDGREIGKVQTRRGRGRTDIITMAENVYVVGHDVDWLVRQQWYKHGINASTAGAV